jgi:hypothetical protein
LDALLALAFLACPVGMGLMMWFMMRGSRRSREGRSGGDSLPDLKAEQARLAEKIQALERPSAEVKTPTKAR